MTRDGVHAGGSLHKRRPQPPALHHKLGKMAACSVARVQVQPFRAAAPARGSGARVQQQQPRLAPLRAAAVDVAALEAESLAGLVASPAAAAAAPARRRKVSRRFGTELSKVRGVHAQCTPQGHCPACIPAAKLPAGPGSGPPQRPAVV